MGATHRRVYAVVFVKSKNGTKCKNFAVLLCFSYIPSYALPKISRRGAIGPLATPLNLPLSTWCFWVLHQCSLHVQTKVDFS